MAVGRPEPLAQRTRNLTDESANSLWPAPAPRTSPSYERLQAQLAGDGSEPHGQPRAVHCGWGRLLIGHTYPDPAVLAEALLDERPGERDIALYVAAPQQVLAQAPQQLFLDPSDTLRLWFTDYRPAQRVFRGFRIRRAQADADWHAINALYQGRGMLPVNPELLTPITWAGRCTGWPRTRTRAL